MSEPSTSRQDRVRVSQACESCREKKSKCDGAKPICGRCKLKDLECHYGVSKRVKNQQVMKHLAAKVAQYESILRKSIPTQRKIHYGNRGPAEQSLSESGPTILPSISTHSETTTDLSDTEAVEAQSTSSVPASPQFLGHLRQVGSPPSSTKAWGDSFLDNMSLPPRSLLEHACSAFFQGSAILFTYFEEEDIVTLFDNVYGQENAPQAKISLIQLCAAAAVGCQYYPQRFDASTRMAFISIAKLHVDECIEEAPLSAMRTICLLCMYFAFEKRTAALMYVDMGLQLARMNRIEVLFWQQPPTCWQRVFGSLVFFEGWLCATTGHLPSSQNRELYSSIALMADRSTSISSVVQHEMFKIAIMSTSILQDVYYARFVSSTTINSYKNQLQQWLLALPEYMRLDYLLSLDEREQYLRPIFLVHLLYMNTVILVYRRVLAELAHLGFRLSDATIFEQAQSFLEPCLWTGRQVAKLLEIALSQDQLFQKCWMTINATYTTCNVLLYFVSYQLMHNKSSDEVSYDVAAAKQCIKVLASCGEVDEAASHYFSATTILYEQLFHIHESIASNSDDEKQQDPVKQKDQLQKIFAVTASLLIHPFDGGFRREVKKVQDIFPDLSRDTLESSASPKAPSDVDMGTPSAESIARESGTHFFISDLFYKKALEVDSDSRGKDKKPIQDSGSISFTSDLGAVFGS